MLRRFSTKAPVLATNSARRNFFYCGTGEEGVSGATMKQAVNIIYCAWVVGALLIYKVIFGYYSPKRQWLMEVSDIWEDDGTVMQGPESVANLKVYHERLMPYMDEINTKIKAAK